VLGLICITCCFNDHLLFIILFLSVAIG
jgi:hypothetical protein